MKRHITCTIDSELLDKLRTRVENRSGLMERLFTNYMRYIEGNKLDKLGIQKKLEGLETSKEKTVSEIEALRQQLDQIAQEERESELKMIEDEQKRQEEADKCKICGNPIGDAKRSELGVYSVHQSCFLSADRKKINELIRGEENGNNKG